MAASKPNPKRLALRIIAGAVLASGSFFITLLPVFHAQPLSSPLRALRNAALILPFALGLTLWLLAYRQLKRGYNSSLWPESELAPVRTLVNQPYWTGIFLTLFVLAVAMVVFTAHGGAFIYITMLPLNALSSIRRLVTPAGDRTDTIVIDYRDAKPLHSDHWGEAPRTHNDALSS